jgi:tetratricopeptide (TPR) repeat protein
MREIVTLRAVALCACLCFSQSAALADARDDAAARQAEIYEDLLQTPDDPELMLSYARAAVAAEDYEAAIATLERALIFSPGQAGLQMELGAAYFRIGAYQAAQYYFEEAREAGLAPAADERAQEFLVAIADRTSVSRFSGTLMIGPILSSNANLGPDDRVVQFFGLPATLSPSADAQSDVGLRAVAQIRHDYDLGGADLDTWRTEGSFYGLRFAEEEQGNVLSGAVTTGPFLSLDDSAYGLKARPFLGVRLTGQDDQLLFQEYGAGVAFSETFDRNWSGFLRVGAGWRDYRSEADDFDAAIIRGIAGAGYSPKRGVTIIGALVSETDRAESDAQSNFEIGARVAANWDYDPTIVEAGDLWTLSGYAQLTGRWYDEADPTVDPNTTRTDTDFRLGAAQRFRFQDGWGVQVDVDALFRNSNISNFEFSSINGAVSVVYEF